MSGNQNQLPLRTSSEAVRDAIREIIRAAHKDHGHYQELPRDPNPIEVPGFDFSTPVVAEEAADGHYSLLGMSIYGKVFARDTSTLSLDGEQMSGSGWAFVLTPGGIDYYSWQLWDCNSIEANSPNIVMTELSGGWDGDRPTPIFADFGEDVEFTASDNITPVVPHKGLGSLFKNSLTGDIFYWDGNLWEMLVSEPEWEAIAGKPATFPPSAHTHTRVLTAADKLPGIEGDKLVITQAGEYYVDSETGLCYIELPSDGFPGIVHIANASSDAILVLVPGSGEPVATVAAVSIAHLAFLDDGWYEIPTPTNTPTAHKPVAYGSERNLAAAFFNFPTLETANGQFISVVIEKPYGLADTTPAESFAALYRLPLPDPLNPIVNIEVEGRGPYANDAAAAAAGVPVGRQYYTTAGAVRRLSAGWAAAQDSASTVTSSADLTLTASHSNVIIYMTNVAPAQILLGAADTSDGFHCTVVRLGGEVTFVTTTGTIKSVDDYVKIDKVNGAAGVLQLDATNFLLSGQLGA